MDKDLGFRRNIGYNMPTGKYNPPAAETFGLAGPGQVMHRHLGRSEQRKLGHRIFQHRKHAEILYNRSVNPQPCSRFGSAQQLRKLIVKHDDIDRLQDLGPMQMAVFHRAGQLFLVEVSGVAPGVQRLAAEVNRICSAVDRGGQRFKASGRGKDFGSVHISVSVSGRDKNWGKRRGGRSASDGKPTCNLVQYSTEQPFQTSPGRGGMTRL